MKTKLCVVLISNESEYYLVPEPVMDWVESVPDDNDCCEVVPENICKLLEIEEENVSAFISPGSWENDRVLNLTYYFKYKFDSFKEVHKFIKENDEFELSDNEYEYLAY